MTEKIQPIRYTLETKELTMDFIVPSDAPPLDMAAFIRRYDLMIAEAMLGRPPPPPPEPFVWPPRKAVEALFLANGLDPKFIP